MREKNEILINIVDNKNKKTETRINKEGQAFGSQGRRKKEMKIKTKKTKKKIKKLTQERKSLFGFYYPPRKR